MTRRAILTGAAACGVLVWVGDAVLDWLLIAPPQQSFLGLLATDVPRHAVVSRLLALGILLLFGLVMIRISASRQAAGAEVRRVAAEYRAVVDTMTDGLVMYDEHGAITHVNNKACLLLDEPASAVLGRQIATLLPVLRTNNPAGQPPGPHKVILRRAGGDEVVTIAAPQAIRDAAGQVVHGFVVLTDVTDLEQTTSRLRGERERAQRYLDLAPVIFVLLDVHGTVRLINRQGCAMLGRSEEEILGRNWFAHFLPPEDRAAVHQVFDQLMAGQVEPAESYENPVLDRDGRRRIVAWRNTILRDDAGRPTGTLSAGEDITNRKEAEAQRAQLEDQLRQAQKVEAIGQLVGGIAHDFNNLLTAILGSVEITRDAVRAQLPADSLPSMGLEQIEQAALRAAALTRQLLAFSRRTVLRPEILSLNEVLRNLERMLRRLVTEDITLELRLRDDLPPLEADVGQLEQIVINLVVNARDAMAHGGALTVATDVAAPDPVDDSAAHRAAPPTWVRLIVRDTGAGIHPDVRPRIFEPFFTTKPFGQGTGLGLATVQAIVQNLGGVIRVDSAPGHGSTFEILLPATDVAIPQLTSDTSRPGVLTGSESVLVCEDDPAVRNLAAQMLRAGGYEVLVAENGHEALALANSWPRTIDALVTDVIMPDMNGRQLAESLRRVQPDVKVLYVSGYPADVIAHHGVLDPNIDLLEKPFTRRDLLGRLRRALDQPRSGATRTQPAAPAQPVQRLIQPPGRR